MKSLYVWLTGTALLAVPFLAAAQVTNANDLAQLILKVLNAIVPLLIGFAILFFLWALVRYMLRADDAAAQAEARSYMVWGIIIIFVMVSVWGLINVLAQTFKFNVNPLPVPKLPTLIDSNNAISELDLLTNDSESFV